MNLKLKRSWGEAELLDSSREVKFGKIFDRANLISSRNNEADFRERNKRNVTCQGRQWTALHGAIRSAHDVLAATCWSTAICRAADVQRQSYACISPRTALNKSLINRQTSYSAVLIEMKSIDMYVPAISSNFSCIKNCFTIDWVTRSKVRVIEQFFKSTNNLWWIGKLVTLIKRIFVQSIILNA